VGTLGLDSLDCPGRPVVPFLSVVVTQIHRSLDRDRQGRSAAVFMTWQVNSLGPTNLPNFWINASALSRAQYYLEQAYLHLIPTIDMASWMHADNNKRLDALMTHAMKMRGNGFWNREKCFRMNVTRTEGV